MRAARVVVLAASAAVSACAPYPVYAPPPPLPLIASGEHLRKCAMLREEIGHQQRVAASSGVMETWLVEGAVRLNAANAISGLEQQAAIEGCPL